MEKNKKNCLPEWKLWKLNIFFSGFSENIQQQMFKCHETTVELQNLVAPIGQLCTTPQIKSSCKPWNTAKNIHEHFSFGFKERKNS